ncbi:MAG TPA: oxidoreductase, partial [Dysgonomonas sp.]|nr:oxidoreductase [Dysgonomonas sp.]
MKILDKKSVIITGSATGLGFATAKECLANGAYLTLVDNSEEKLDKAIDELKKEYPDAK